MKWKAFFTWLADKFPALKPIFAKFPITWGKK